MARRARWVPLFLAAACAVSAAAPTREATPALREYRRVQAAAMGFADTYEAFLAEAADDMARRVGTVDARKRALGLKLWGTTAAYTIVADERPDAALIDLVVLVTLHQLAWQEREGPFGEYVVILRRALDRLAQEAWNLVATVLDEAEEREELRRIIETWRENNPDHSYVEFVRFRDITVAADAPRLLGRYRRGLLFASMSDAAREAAQVKLVDRLAAEREATVRRIGAELDR